MYADDVVTHFTGGDISTVKALQEDLNHVEHWMRKYQLYF